MDPAYNEVNWLTVVNNAENQGGNFQTKQLSFEQLLHQAQVINLIGLARGKNGI